MLISSTTSVAKAWDLSLYVDLYFDFWDRRRNLAVGTHTHNKCVWMLLARENSDRGDGGRPHLWP